MSSEPKVPRLLTAQELAVTLNVPLWRIYELVADGKAPPSMRIGKTIRFPEDGVVQWIHVQTSSRNPKHLATSDDLDWLEMKVTLDTNVLPAEDLIRLAGNEYDFAVVSVTAREVHGTSFEIHLEPVNRVAETALWDDSKWDEGVWAADNDPLETILAVVRGTREGTLTKEWP